MSDMSHVGEPLTEAELARFRAHGLFEVRKELADRILATIDQLRAERDEARDYMVKGAGIVLALESRLSLAIEGLRETTVHSASAVTVANIARRTLAKIEEGSC